jgi:hypothetical protein
MDTEIAIALPQNKCSELARLWVQNDTIAPRKFHRFPMELCKGCPTKLCGIPARGTRSRPTISPMMTSATKLSTGRHASAGKTDIATAGQANFRSRAPALFRDFGASYSASASLLYRTIWLPSPLHTKTCVVRTVCDWQATCSISWHEDSYCCDSFDGGKFAAGAANTQAAVECHARHQAGGARNQEGG